MRLQPPGVGHREKNADTGMRNDMCARVDFKVVLVGSRRELQLSAHRNISNGI